MLLYRNILEIKIMLVIKSASDSFHNFFQVVNTETGFIVFQSEYKEACKEYVKNNGGIATLNPLSKATLNAAAKLNKAVSLVCNVELYGLDEALEMDYQGTLTLWLDGEANHEGDVIYKVYKTPEGFKAELWAVWTEGNFPQSFENEKGLKEMLKSLS